MELALHLLMRAVIPQLGLKECLHNWHAISQTLAEAPRRRKLQIEALMLRACRKIKLTICGGVLSLTYVADGPT
jgi:hypothetical protein